MTVRQLWEPTNLSFNIKSITSGTNVRKIVIIGIIAVIAMPLIKKLKGGF